MSARAGTYFGFAQAGPRYPLNHPNIITIYDIDEAEGVRYIAMEYVPGKTLERLIARRVLREVARWRLARRSACKNSPVAVVNVCDSPAC